MSNAALPYRIVDHHNQGWLAQGDGTLNRKVERALSEVHDDRLANMGQADWLVATTTESGIAIEAIYDHPHRGDEAAIRIVSVWRVDP